MTTAAEAGRRGLEACLDRLDEAIAAASDLGIPVDTAVAVRDEAHARLGFPADVYVLALVGGTGVGKSSVLNALAGRAVSRASVRRPTTDRPVAWVPVAARDDLDGLLEHLDVGEVHEHDQPLHGAVAILDLPDIDSVDPGHREQVEGLLPRVDAVAWVTDPEKYHDAVLHDDFLRRWLPRLDRQAIVLNKRDRLDAGDEPRLRRDLEQDLERALRVPGRRIAPVLLTTTVDGDAGTEELRGWLASEIEAKRIVRAGRAAAIAAAIGDLARAAGVEGEAAPAPLLDRDARRLAGDAASAAVLRVVDLPGLERQAVAATRALARARGAGPIGTLTSAIYRLSGREARVADPDAYLVRWRERGSLAPAVDALRTALVVPVREAPAPMRPAVARASDPERLESGLRGAVDRALAEREVAVPTSRVWTILGALQTLATVALVLAVAWIVVWILARPPVDTVTLPLVGQVPVPLVALAIALLAGYLLARALGAHAGWLGRRWAARLGDQVRARVHAAIADTAFEPLDRLDAGRRSLRQAAHHAADDCRRP
ncbi:MAG: GTPase [Chloroflexota bacterium]